MTLRRGYIAFAIFCITCAVHLIYLLHHCCMAFFCCIVFTMKQQILPFNFISFLQTQKDIHSLSNRHTNERTNNHTHTHGHEQGQTDSARQTVTTGQRSKYTKTHNNSDMRTRCTRARTCSFGEQQHTNQRHSADTNPPVAYQ